METKLVSPCKKCEAFPCTGHKKCKLRETYVDKYRGQDIMKASETDGTGYRILLP